MDYSTQIQTVERHREQAVAIQVKHPQLEFSQKPPKSREDPLDPTFLLNFKITASNKQK